MTVVSLDRCRCRVRHPSICHTSVRPLHAYSILYPLSYPSYLIRFAAGEVVHDHDRKKDEREKAAAGATRGKTWITELAQQRPASFSGTGTGTAAVSWKNRSRNMPWFLQYVVSRSFVASFFFFFFCVCVCVRSGLSSPLPSVFGPGVCFALGRKNFIGPLFFFLRRETSQPNRTALHRTEQQPLVGHGAGLPPFLAA